MPPHRLHPPILLSAAQLLGKSWRDILVTIAPETQTGETDPDIHAEQCLEQAAGAIEVPLVRQESVIMMAESAHHQALRYLRRGTCPHE